MRKLIITTLILVLAAAVGLPTMVNRYMQPIVHHEDTVVRLFSHQTNKIITMSLEDYVTGVVAAEMPAEFPVEALKAQAVAARTYIYKRMAAGGVVNKCTEEADTCDDPSHGQAFIAREEMKNRWGTVNYYRYYYKIRMAVDDTAGQIVTYKGQPIDPVFHSSCGGRTENSEDVWKYKVAYLRSVNCPYDVGKDKVDSVTYTLSEIGSMLKLDTNSIAVITGSKQPVSVVETTSTGRPKTIVAWGKRMAATDFRRELQLRSTNFKYKLNDNSVTFETIGYGHGVGLCQYGAKGLAEHGKDYQEILKHYYTGVQINSIKI